MESETNNNNNNNNNINPILKITKNVIHSNNNFKEYFLEKNDSLYLNQFPLISTGNKNPSINIYRNKNRYLLNNKFSSTALTNYDIENIKSIRIKEKRSKKLPPLCPLFNNHGELLRSVSTSSKLLITSSNNNTFLSNNDKLNNKIYNSYKNIISNFNIKNENDNNKNIFNVYDDFIPFDIENNNNEKDKIINEENEQKILMCNSNVFNKIIKKNINDIKNKNIYIKSNFLSKKFFFGKEKNETFLELTSIKLIFEDLNNKENNLSIFLPFYILPIFYYKNEEIFKSIIINIIKFKNNYNEIYFDENNFFNVISNHPEYNNINNNNKIKKENFYENFFKNKTQNKNNNNNNNENNNLENNLNNNNIFKASIKFNHLEPDFIYSEIFPINNSTDSNINNNNNYNIFSFIWTTPIKKYKINIILPEITLKIESINITIKKFIEKEMIIFLFNKKFINWDYFILKYLYNFKEFRKLLENLQSHSPKFNKILNLNLSTKIKFYKLNNYYVNSFHTDEFNDNYLNTFNNFVLLVTYYNLSNDMKYLYVIHFNFLQIKKIKKIEKFIDRINFLLKFIEIDFEWDKLTFNYDELNSFDENNWLKNVKKFCGKNYFDFNINIENKTIQNNQIEYNLNKNIKIKIEIKNPILTIEKNNNYNQKINYFIQKDLENKIKNFDLILTNPELLLEAINEKNKINNFFTENNNSIDNSNHILKKKTNFNNKIEPINSKIFCPKKTNLFTAIKRNLILKKLKEDGINVNYLDKNDIKEDENGEIKYKNISKPILFKMKKIIKIINKN